ncbi:MAG: hypothetical protein PQJ50_07665 [Spirochaetales bacterium]|nr:hypothetical protein [Spirochaetales bacterium]
MKRYVLILLMVLFTAGTVYSTPFANSKMADFFESLKMKEYEKGIVELLEGTSLEEKILNVNQTRQNWVNQFQQINDLYGDYWSYELIKTIKLGNLEESYYFFYCDIYVIQIVVTEYKGEEKTDIINFVFNDQVLDTLRNMGKVQ